jgi:cell division septal protein FtsQ
MKKKHKTKNMSKRSIILFLVITSILVLLVGFYRVYEIFYHSYFNQTEYCQIAYTGNKEISTKKEILFYGFKNLKIIAISTIISILIINGKKIAKQLQ